MQTISIMNTELTLMLWNASVFTENNFSQIMTDPCKPRSTLTREMYIFSFFQSDITFFFSIHFEDIEFMQKYISVSFQDFRHIHTTCIHNQFEILSIDLVIVDVNREQDLALKSL